MFQTPGYIASLGLLILRVGFGYMMAVGHGLPKLRGYMELKDQIGDPMNLLAKPYAAQALIGAEFFCAILVAVGLLTRFTALPLAYAMGLAAFIVHAQDPTFLGMNVVKAQEPALVYFIAFLAIVFTGPGRFSLDQLFFGRRAPRI